MTRYSISLTNCHLRSVAAENFGEAKWRARSALFHVCPLRWAHPSIDPDRFASKAITRGLAVPHSSMANFPSFVRITTSECPGSVLRRVAALTHHFVMPHALRIMEWRLRPAGSWKDVAIAKSMRRIAPGGQAGRRRTSEHAALAPRRLARHQSAPGGCKRTNEVRETPRGRYNDRESMQSKRKTKVKTKVKTGASRLSISYSYLLTYPSPS